MNLLYVGRINQRQKNFSEIYEIYSSVKKQKISTTLTVFSNDKLLQNMQNIDFRGFNKLWFSSLNLKLYTLIFSSWYEGMPLSLLEFIHNGGNKCLCRSAPWSISILNSNNLYTNLEDAVDKCLNNNLVITSLQSFNTYIDMKRFNDDIKKLGKWI